MNQPTLEVAHTIHDDTAARHLRKYTNKNPLQRLTLGRFFTRLNDKITDFKPRNLLELGCGEGFLLRELRNRGFKCPNLIGLDLRSDAIVQARSLHPESETGWKFECANLFTWQPPQQKFDIVLASQVMEHIPDPAPILKRLLDLTAGSLVLTVPCEPWFQMLNFIRGRDLLRFGNHPEHVNRWSHRGFEKFVSEHAEVVSSEVVFPFIIVVAKPRGDAG